MTALSPVLLALAGIALTAAIGGLLAGASRRFSQEDPE